ncbi:hypothetical protein EPI10_002148 [Gossypium australe]|uniref:Uncharacterized protein n=1 Tax=Gossypium australe TaxID=47621 RepID=A0A5B6VDP9_9ROSI|nr:hypothetical protein EPI10_002148 [Gossypium australe]
MKDKMKDDQVVVSQHTLFWHKQHGPFHHNPANMGSKQNSLFQKNQLRKQHKNYSWSIQLLVDPK